MKRLFFALIFFIGFLGADSATNIKKVVFDLTTSNLTTLENRMIEGIVFNNAHYQGIAKKLNTVIVIHGSAYKFFVKDISKTKCKADQKLHSREKEIHEKLASLAKNYNVKFLMCGVGMKSREIKKDNILKFVKIVPSAMIALIDAQNDGYAFVPID